MTVAELIEMLGRCPPSYPVRIAYDSMVCIYAVEESDSFIIHKNSTYCAPGIYLCAGCAYCRDDEGGLPIPAGEANQKDEAK
jgi:hypothetical protein